MQPIRTFTLLLLALVAGCGGARALYDQPDEPTEYADAALIHLNALGDQGATLREDPAVPEALKERIRNGWRAAVCSDAERGADEPTSDCEEGPRWRATKAIEAYENLASAETEQELQAAIAALSPLIVELIYAVSGGR